MICPLKFKNGDNPLCSKGECGFYSCESQKCAVAAISNITNEFTDLKSTLNNVTNALDDISRRLLVTAAAVSTARILKR